MSSVSACSGVFERLRRVQVVPASGASKTIRPGCGAERWNQVYMPRRKRSGPALVFHSRGTCVRTYTPGGCGGNTLGPPTTGDSKPLALRATSRTTSASSRSRLWRASSRLRGSSTARSGRVRDDWR